MTTETKDWAATMTALIHKKREKNQKETLDKIAAEINAEYGTSFNGSYLYKLSVGHIKNPGTRTVSALGEYCRLNGIDPPGGPLKGKEVLALHEVCNSAGINDLIFSISRLSGQSIRMVRDLIGSLETIEKGRKG